MSQPATTRALAAGEKVGGHFAPEGADYELAGTLRWSSDGATLELIDQSGEWPKNLRGDPYTVHGRLGTSDSVTLLGTWTQQVVLGEITRKVHSSMLALEECISAQDRWSRAIYSTASLSEWRADTGLEFSRPRPYRRLRRLLRRAPAATLRVEARRPTRDEVRLPGALVAFAGEADSPVTYGPTWTIGTRQVLVVYPDQPATASALRQRYAEPLLALTSLAADRPDGLTREVLLDEEKQRRVEVWRAGPVIEPREWRPTGGFLFPVEAFTDFAASIQAWWELHEQVWPALGFFGDHVSQGPTYAPTRLITVYSALERYADARHSTGEFERLRDYAGVPSDVHGCTNRALTLLGASRGYFAHLQEPKRKLTREEIQEGLLPSTRKAAALMQACLLRDLGLDAATTEELMRAHYASWPLTPND